MRDIDLPDEPYWRCNRCGMMFLDSFKGEIVCGSIDLPVSQACPMEYVDPQPVGGAIVRTPGVGNYRFIAGLILFIAALVIGGLLAK